MISDLTPPSRKAIDTIRAMTSQMMGPCEATDAALKELEDLYSAALSNYRSQRRSNLADVYGEERLASLTDEYLDELEAKDLTLYDVDVAAKKEAEEALRRAHPADVELDALESGLTVGHLRRAIGGLPDDAPMIFDHSEWGWLALGDVRALTVGDSSCGIRTVSPALGLSTARIVLDSEVGE